MRALALPAFCHIGHPKVDLRESLSQLVKYDRVPFRWLEKVGANRRNVTPIERHLPSNAIGRKIDWLFSFSIPPIRPRIEILYERHAPRATLSVDGRAVGEVIDVLTASNVAKKLGSRIPGQIDSVQVHGYDSGLVVARYPVGAIVGSKDAAQILLSLLPPLTDRQRRTRRIYES